MSSNDIKDDYNYLKLLTTRGFYFEDVRELVRKLLDASELHRDASLFVIAPQTLIENKPSGDRESPYCGLF